MRDDFLEALLSFLVALEIEEAENSIEDAVRKGLSIKEAREKYRYHSLQTKK